jgi:hypothetical protein
LVLVNAVGIERGGHANDGHDHDVSYDPKVTSY